MRQPGEPHEAQEAEQDYMGRTNVPVRATSFTGHGAGHLSVVSDSVLPRASSLGAIRLRRQVDVPLPTIPFPASAQNGLAREALSRIKSWYSGPEMKGK